MFRIYPCHLRYNFFELNSETGEGPGLTLRNSGQLGGVDLNSQRGMTVSAAGTYCFRLLLIVFVFSTLVFEQFSLSCLSEGLRTSASDRGSGNRGRSWRGRRQVDSAVKRPVPRQRIDFSSVWRRRNRQRSTGTRPQPLPTETRQIRTVGLLCVPI